MKRAFTIFAAVCLLAGASFGACAAKTTVADTLYNSTQTPLTGTVYVTNTMVITDSGGCVVAANTRVSAAVVNGAFSIALVPNNGSSPSGTSYTAEFHVSSGIYRETWIVPASGSANLLAVRALTPPVPTTAIPVSQIVFTGGLVDFSSAASTRIYKSGALANRPVTCQPLVDFYNVTDSQQAGFGIDRCNATGDGWDAIGNGGLDNAPFTALMAELQEGVSASLQVLGDSTANGTDEWAYLTAQWLGSKFPSYTVKHILWNDTTQDYDPPTTIQTGAAGVRYANFIGSGGDMRIAPNDIVFPATDWDIRVKVAPANYRPSGQQCFIAKFGGSSARGMRFEIRSDGLLIFSWASNATTFVDKFSTASVPNNAGGTIIWLRVTHTVNNGSGGNDIIFYTSPDGVTWTQLGATVTTAGIAAPFNPSAQDWEIGGRADGTAELFVGQIYSAEVRNGIGGLFDGPHQVDGWAPRNPGATFAGAPELWIVNGSMPGAGLTYLSDPTRLPKMTPKYGQSSTIFNVSHNEFSFIGATEVSTFGSWVTSVKGRLQLSQMVITTQNPETQRNPREHALRNEQFLSYMQVNGMGYVDAYRAFLLDPRVISLLVDPNDGIHTLPAGSILWAQTVEEAMRRSMR